MPRGANPKREREYEELKEQFKTSGRYRGREEEVAARIVNKQRAQYGETKAAQTRKKSGQSPDRGVPIRDYQHLTVDEITRQFSSLSRRQLAEVKAYEEQHKHRRTLLEGLDQALSQEAHARP